MRVLSVSEWRQQSQLLDERNRLRGSVEELRDAAMNAGTTNLTTSPMTSGAPGRCNRGSPRPRR